MSVTELEPTDIGTDDAPPMEHILCPERGFPYAICGTRCSKITRDHVPDDDTVDCVVCESLWKEGGY